jgi:HNH endonuclease
MDADITIGEATQILDPQMTASQVKALIAIAGIQPCGLRRTGKPGQPARTYPYAEVMDAHLEEAFRTSRQFDGNDWVASALLARQLIITDTAAGAIWWADGTRAETLLANHYGAICINGCVIPAHRVIWIAAEGEIPAGIQVNHINRLRWDNRRANLELVTLINNIRHGHGCPYLNTADEGRRSRVPLPPPPGEDIDQALIPRGGSLIRNGGVFRRAGH